MFIIEVDAVSPDDLSLDALVDANGSLVSSFYMLSVDLRFIGHQFVLFVISLWILQVVLKFWRYLSAVDPARARVLASPRRRHAASQAAHNERAVRRLESGASSGEN